MCVLHSSYITTILLATAVPVEADGDGLPLRGEADGVRIRGAGHGDAEGADRVAEELPHRGQDVLGGNLLSQVVQFTEPTYSFTKVEYLLL